MMGNTAPVFAASMASVEGKESQVTIVCAVEDRNACREIAHKLDFGDSMPEHFSVVHFETFEAVVEALNSGFPCDVILLDLLLGNAVGGGALNAIRAANPDVPIIAFSEVDDTDLAVEAISQGADDFLPREYIALPQFVARSVFTVIEKRKAEKEKETLQDQLIQAEKLDSLGRIAAGVAHEVKNPLATIQMALAYMSTFVPEVEDPQFSDACDFATEASARAVDIISGMVDFSRNDSISMREGCLNEVTSKSVKLLRYEINKSKTRVHLDLDSSIPPTDFDEGKIQQLLINLIRNSIQAMSDCDKVIHLSTLILSPEDFPNSPNLRELAQGCDNENLIAIEIRDEGPGIGDQNPATLFEPFYTTKEEGEGTGLGLSVVFQIVKLHRAQIRVQNMNNPSGLRTRVYFGNSKDRKTTQ